MYKLFVAELRCELPVRCYVIPLIVQVDQLSLPNDHIKRHVAATHPRNV